MHVCLTYTRTLFWTWKTRVESSSLSTHQMQNVHFFIIADKKTEKLAPTLPLQSENATNCLKKKFEKHFLIRVHFWKEVRVRVLDEVSSLFRCRRVKKGLEFKWGSTMKPLWMSTSQKLAKWFTPLLVLVWSFKSRNSFVLATLWYEWEFCVHCKKCSRLLYFRSVPIHKLHFGSQKWMESEWTFLAKSLYANESSKYSLKTRECLLRILH